MRAYTKTELLALSPEIFLADGFRDDTGQTRPELSAEYANAAAAQLMEGGMPAQELSFTYEAFRLLLPQYEGAPADRVRDALREALATVTRMIRQPNNAVLVGWLAHCLGAIAEDGDIEAMLTHMRAVLRLCTLFAAMPEPDEAPEAI